MVCSSIIIITSPAGNAVRYRLHISLGSQSSIQLDNWYIVGSDFAAYVMLAHQHTRSTWWVQLSDTSLFQLRSQLVHRRHQFVSSVLHARSAAQLVNLVGVGFAFERFEVEKSAGTSLAPVCQQYKSCSLASCVDRAVTSCEGGSWLGSV